MINIYVFDLLWFPGGLKLNLIKSSGTNYNVKYTKKIHEVIYSFKKFNLNIENKISYRVNDAVTWCFFQEISKKKEKKCKIIFQYIYNTFLYNSRPFSTSPHDPETTEGKYNLDCTRVSRNEDGHMDPWPNGNSARMKALREVGRAWRVIFSPPSPSYYTIDTYGGSEL